MTQQRETPEQRRERLLAHVQKTKPPGIVPPSKEKPRFDPDLVPEVERSISEEDNRLNSFMDRMDVLDAYSTFIGKMQPDKSRRRKEGIMVSCPLPNHPDNDPSAWCNTDENVWFCGGCQVGGDVYDLGAIHFGYAIPDYKKNGSFPTLKRQMAEKMGYSVVKSITGENLVVINAPLAESYPDSTSSTVEAPTTPVGLVPVGDNNVVQLHVVEELPDDIDIDPLKSEDLFIDWEKIVPEQTFLRTFMQSCTIDDLPHEYYLWAGLQALGFAAGNDVILADFKPVKPNLFVCLYGRTGVGKSRALGPYVEVIEKSMPFEGTDQFSAPTGVRIQPTPASAEALFDSFRWDILDSSTMKPTDMASISGLVKIEELSAFIARASRLGSAMKETLIEMYDVYGGMITLHSRGAGVARIKTPFMQLTTTTQPKAIHAFLRKTDMETGFLNRIVFAAGRSRRAPLSYGGVSIDIDDAAKQLSIIRAWAASGHRMKLEGDALDVWDNFFHDNIAKFKTGEAEAESMFSRVDLTLKKLIVLFTVNEMLLHPTAQTVERAISLYPYLGMTYSTFGGDIAFNDVTECQNRLIKLIEEYVARHGVYPTARQIGQTVGKKFDSEMIIRSLKNLVTLDVLFEEASAGGRGRPTKHYGLTGKKK